MSKLSLYWAIMLVVLITTQSCMVNTTSPQVSESVKDSKKNGVFIMQLHAESNLDDLLVEEAWLERIWFYDSKGLGYVKMPSDGYHLCFKVKQVPGARFMLDNSLDWVMLDESTASFVGIKATNSSSGVTGVYVYEMPFPVIPDSIRFNLLVNPRGKKVLPISDENVSVGSLVFRKAENQ